MCSCPVACSCFMSRGQAVRIPQGANQVVFSSMRLLLGGQRVMNNHAQVVLQSTHVLPPGGPERVKTTVMTSHSIYILDDQGMKVLFLKSVDAHLPQVAADIAQDLSVPNSTDVVMVERDSRQFRS